jgi:putative membrane protein
MLKDVLAHSGRAPAPHDVWAAWDLDPALLVTIAVAGWIYGRGLRTRSDTVSRRAWCFAGGLAVLVVALESPLDAMSSALASAHMVQHILLLLAAAPLMVLSAPFGALVRGTPSVVVRIFARRRKLIRLTQRIVRALRDPIFAWMLHVGAIWFWHAAVPYNAALQSETIHLVEHGSFLITGILFWRAVLGSRSPRYAATGLGVLLVFAMGVQSVFLSALLTFAPAPWYAAYAETTSAWGLDPLADQQLAGVIMWVPAGAVYVGAALALLIAWLRGTEDRELALAARFPSSADHARSVVERVGRSPRDDNGKASFGRGRQRRKNS